MGGPEHCRYGLLDEAGLEQPMHWLFLHKPTSHLMGLDLSPLGDRLRKL